MKCSLLFLCLAISAVLAADEETKASDSQETVKTYKRLIPADVLRGNKQTLLFRKINIPNTRLN